MCARQGRIQGYAGKSSPRKMTTEICWVEKYYSSGSPQFDMNPITLIHKCPHGLGLATIPVWMCANLRILDGCPQSGQPEFRFVHRMDKYVVAHRATFHADLDPFWLPDRIFRGVQDAREICTLFVHCSYTGVGLIQLDTWTKKSHVTGCQDNREQ